MALIFAMVLGADSIDDCDVLRAGPHAAAARAAGSPAPSTLGTFLRAFTFGHVRQLDALLGRGARAGVGGRRRARRRAAGDRRRQLRRRGLRPHKQGAALRLHPACAATTRSSPPAPTPARCCTSACARARRTPQKGMLRFVRRADRPRRARRRDRRQAAARRLGVLEHEGRSSASSRPAGSTRSACAMQRTSAPAIEAIAEHAWQTLIDYPDDGEAQIAETDLRRAAADRPAHPPARRPGRAVARLAALRVRHQPHRGRSRSSRPSTASTPSSSWSIRDLKDQALAHFPSGHFNANAAWTVIAALAHNLLRWTALLGLPDTTVRAARTAAPPAARAPRPPDPHRPRAGRCTCPPAGPGTATSPTRSPASARSPPPPEQACSAMPLCEYPRLAWFIIAA